MTSTNHRGKVIFRHWNSKTGLQETEAPFSSLGELFDLCLQAHPTLLVDRVIVEGDDSNGAERMLTLVFQSVTVADEG